MALWHPADTKRRVHLMTRKDDGVRQLLGRGIRHCDRPVCDQLSGINDDTSPALMRTADKRPERRVGASDV